MTLPRLCALAAAVALAAPVATAQTSLFTPLDGARVSLAPAQTQFLNALASERGVEAVDLVAADAALLAAAPELRLTLPDTEVVLRTLSATPRRTGHLSWVGRAEGGATAAWAVLVARDGQITGEVHTGGYVYPVRPLTGGLHAVARKSMADYQTHPDGYEAFVEADRPRIEAQARADADARAAAARRSSATTTVDIIVPYTQDVAAGIADPVALAQSFVDYANLVYVNSSVDMALDLLYTYEIDYATSGSLGTDLDRITLPSDGFMDDAHDTRDAYGADLVALLAGTNTSGVCGIAWVNSGSTQAFSATSAGCGGGTFTHEVGHNMGAAHDARTGGVLAYSYGRGYVNDAGQWATVMAYNNACQDGGGSPTICEEIIPHLSDPAVSYTDTVGPAIGSGPTGVLNAAGTADSTNNARVHRERMATVAAFRSTKALPSSTVGPAALTLAVVPGGSASGAFTVENTAAAGSSALWWRAALSNLDDDTGTPVANACTGAESVDQSSSISFFETNTSGGVESGQSFTAPCTGRLTRVTPAFYGGASGTWEGTLRVYAGDGTGGTEVAAEAVTATNAANGIVTFLDINLTTPVEVESGQVYTWFLDLTSGTTRILFSTTDPYAGGARYRTANGNPASASAQAGEDFTFTASFVAPETWVALGASAGSLDPAASEDVLVTFDATGFPEGSYTGDLVLTTNDPAAPTVTIPLTMNVTAAAEHTLADGRGWRILAVPYESATVGTLAGQNLVQGTPDSYPTAGTNLFTGYDGAAWTAAGANTEAVAPGTGFAWYFYDVALDPDAGDPDNSESVPLPMALGGSRVEHPADVDAALHADGDRWNLLGNPFLLPLDVSGIAGWTGASALDGSVGQVWQCTPNAGPPVECVGSYMTTTALGDLVPAWHGVFFQASSAGTLTVPTSARGVPLRRSTTRLLSFELAATEASAIDRAATVVFREGATDGWDGWDAEKLASLASPSVQIALSGERDGEPRLKAQESRPLDAATFEVPVHVASYGAGTDLVLTWPRFDDIPEDWAVTLTDLETDEAIDLRTTDRYAFSVTEAAARTAAMPGAQARLGAEAPRFTLAVQTANAVSASDDVPAETWLGTPQPNPARTAATVPFGLATAGAVRISVVDLLGREVAVLADGEFGAGVAEAALPAGRLAPGLYVVRLETGDRVLTQRAVVVR